MRGSWNTCKTDLQSWHSSSGMKFLPFNLPLWMIKLPWSCEGTTGTPCAAPPTLKEAAMKKTKKISQKCRRLDHDSRGTVAFRGTPKRSSIAVPCDFYAVASLTVPFRELLVDQLSSQQCLCKHLQGVWQGLVDMLLI
jgi:hypothetical protein